jgi:GAF domain-containing protein
MFHSCCETYFLRHYIAKAYGVRTGLGVPIIANNQVLAVLVFFMLSIRSEDKELVELVTAAATQLGDSSVL